MLTVIGLLMSSVDYIDKTEAMLILKFFKINCHKIDDHKTKIMNLPNDKSIQYRTIGYSSFSRIIEFYKYEYKPRESVFWMKLKTVLEKVEDRALPLIMSKVNLEYFWLDYVTDVNINFDVEHGKLMINIEESDNIYDRILKLICNMLFVSDFNESQDKYKDVNTNLAWAIIYNEINKIKEQNG